MRPDGARCRGAEVGVGQDQQRVLAAEFGREPDQVGHATEVLVEERDRRVRRSQVEGAHPPQVEPAIEAYRKAAPLDERGETYLNLAKVLANEGRLPEAKQAAQQALDKGVRTPEDARRILARTN